MWAGVHDSLDRLVLEVGNWVHLPSYLVVVVVVGGVLRWLEVR